MRWLGLSLALLFAALSFGPQETASATELPPIAVTRTTSELTCRLAYGPSVTFELTYEAHARAQQPETMATSVAELRNVVERGYTKTHFRDYRSASWRIIKTEFASDTFFGERTQRACAKGCALHEYQGVDLRYHAFVAAPAAGADMRTDLKLSDLTALYGAAPRAILSFIGFGDYHGYVTEVPGSPKQIKTDCVRLSAAPKPNN